MLIQLAIEVWMEILDWLRCHRVELAWKFNQLGDRQFSDICQHWLHDYKRNAIELDTLWIGTKSVALRSKCYNRLKRRQPLLQATFGYDWEVVPFAQVEMPPNIRDFRGIRIDYLNGTVLNFLNRMRPLLKDIFLSLDRELPETGATVKALGHLLPLFDGITAIQLEAKLFAHIHEHFDSTFERANILQIHMYYNDPVPEVIGWLRGAKQKEPRMLLLKIENKMGTAMAQLEEFLKIIREDFLRSSSSTSPPVCFFVCVRVRPERQLGAIPEFTRLENGDTGEQLIMEKWEEEVPTWREIALIPLLLVARCPSNANPEWLAERMRAIRDFHIRRQRRHIFVDWQFETGGLITEAKKRKLQLK